MPSKGKKPLRPSTASSDRSSASRTPSRTPDRRPETTTTNGGGGDDDEALLQQLLSEASAKYPNLISDSAFCGRVSELDPSPSKGNHATVWLSEAAMVSYSLAPGSLVSVSLVGKGCNFPLESLTEECARHFGIDVDNNFVCEAGCYFAIASVFPSRKVLKNGVRLSWGVSCTMGFPDIGKSIFVSLVNNISMSQQPNKTGGVSHFYIFKCKDLYLKMVPPKDELVTLDEGLSTSDNKTESVGVQIGNRKVSSPKTPSYQSRLSSPISNQLHSRESKESTSNLDSSLCWDTSAARLALADEKVNELLQIYAARWLYGRHLLVGNFVTVPICGQFCVFQVEGADKLPAGCSNQYLMCEGKADMLPHEIQTSDSLDEVDAVHLVGTKTKIHLSDPKSLIGEHPNKEGLPTGDPKSNAIRDKEAGDHSRLGGLSKEFAAMKEIIALSLVNKNALPMFPLKMYKGVLLHGPPGTGKTSLASSCVRDAGASLFSINGPEIVSQYYGESEQTLHGVFDSARRAAPSVVFIDELDAIAPARKDGGEELSLRLVATLSKLMDEIKSADGVLVIAATNRPDSIDCSLRRSGRLDREIEIGVPSPEQRLDILQTLLTEIYHSLSNTEIQSLALATHGFVGADLAALCNEAAMTALRRHIKYKSSDQHFKEPCSILNGPEIDLQGSDVRSDEDLSSGDHVDSLLSSLSELTVSSKPIYPVNLQRAQEVIDTSCNIYTSDAVEEEKLLKVTADDFEKAKMKVRPSGMREVMLELPNVRWEDVGGQTKVKKQLIEAVQWPQIYPDAFKRIGNRPPRGLLMIGPPGCSKTLMARAVASEAKLNFLAVKGPELFSKWVGESEKAVRSLFAKARANSPAIIFFDEIDGLAITRGQENDGITVADRVLSQLLVEMDGLNKRTGLTVIAATNRPDKIDPALLRPGRFDRLLDVQPPDETDREDIFRIHMRNMPCSSDVITKDLAQLTEGYTGADIKLICREAAITALEESLDTSEVSMAHFKIGIERVQPSDVQFYKELAAEFRRFVDTGSACKGCNQLDS